MNHFTFVPRASRQGRDLYPILRRKMRTRGFWRARTDWARAQKAKGRYMSSQALIRRIADNQQLTLEAAMAGDADMAFRALLNDPLCTIPTDCAWRMFKELMRANETMLRM